MINRNKLNVNETISAKCTNPLDGQLDGGRCIWYKDLYEEFKSKHNVLDNINTATCITNATVLSNLY
jgi:hypothetical protein